MTHDCCQLKKLKSLPPPALHVTRGCVSLKFRLKHFFTGITSEPAPLGGGGVMGGTKGDLLSSFDMFAHSRLAYSNTTEGSTYEDNRQEQGSSLTSALLRQPQPEPVPTNQ